MMGPYWVAAAFLAFALNQNPSAVGWVAAVFIAWKLWNE